MFGQSAAVGSGVEWDLSKITNYFPRETTPLVSVDATASTITFEFHDNLTFVPLLGVGRFAGFVVTDHSHDVPNFESLSVVEATGMQGFSARTDLFVINDDSLAINLKDVTVHDGSKLVVHVGFDYGTAA